MVAFIQKAHGCIFFCYAIEAQAAQLAISNRLSGREGGGGRRSADVVLPGQEGSGVRL
jgi:hypothetical protein